MAATKQAFTEEKSSAGTKALQGAVTRLEGQVRQLESELQAMEETIVNQDLSTRRGYICRIYRGRDDWFIGCCPTLHAGSQGRTFEEASAQLDIAIASVIEAFADWGRPLPPRDVEALCRG